MKRIVGKAMIAVFFIGLFWWGCIVTGSIWVAVVFFLITAAIIGFIKLALYLIFADKEA